jgi:hypothetical protein
MVVLGATPEMYQLWKGNRLAQAGQIMFPNAGVVPYSITVVEAISVIQCTRAWLLVMLSTKAVPTNTG